MKQGTKSLLPVRVAVPLAECQRIEFVFVQGTTRKMYEYPSDHAVEIDGSTVGLIWTVADKAAFDASRVLMDTRITLKDSEYQPDTAITAFAMDETLFEDAR